MNIDYCWYGRLTPFGVTVHAEHLQPVQAIGPEQLRWVYVEPRRTRRSMVIRPCRNGDKEVPFLILLRLCAVLKRTETN